MRKTRTRFTADSSSTSSGWSRHRGIDYSKVTRYDKFIGDEWGRATTAIKTGEMNKEEAWNNFYDQVEATYPEITVNR